MPAVTESRRKGWSPERILANQAFSRAGGAPLVSANSVRLLKDASENYPAWLSAIESAKKTIYFECYIIRDDKQGMIFSDALISKAREGVKVRVVYDWMGAFGKTSSRYWRHLKENGVEVRCFNPPKIYEPFGWLSRDHRKMICVDGMIGFVSGLCVGQAWVGDSERGIDPWRDTGVEVKGPAVADIVRAFGEVWSQIGDPLPDEELQEIETLTPAGEVALRVVATVPNTGAMYRLDHLVAAMANQTLWMSDAYFLGTSNYVAALRAASFDGVDVRLLVPGASDIRAIVPFSRAGYRPLLEAGIRVFEWNGRMMHAKTAVADSKWARVGSSNLNTASWLGNWELDVIVEDEHFAQEMQEQYLNDLQNSTEILLNERKRVRPASPIPGKRSLGPGRGSAGTVAAGAIRIGHTVGAAITNRRVLGAAEAYVMLFSGLALMLISILTFIWPKAIAVPVSIICFWVSLTLLYRSWKLRKINNEPDLQKRKDQYEQTDRQTN